MDWFPCEGWLIVTVDEGNRYVASIWITHHRCHVLYTDISLSEDVAQLIEEMKNLPASKVFIFITPMYFKYLIRILDLGGSPEEKPED
jgi:hypothetical protein